jgi:hypothetical protein
LASPTFTGVPAAPTAAVDTNTTQLATTAYVLAQAAAATPLADGTAAVGTSTRYARADHVHPTDTTRAPLASPAFTGNPSLPTGTTAVTQSPGNNTTAVATTAFVLANAGSGAVTSVAGRTGAVVLAVADVSGAAPLASPTFTGTVTIPAGASISGYATTASLSSYAPLASPALTGTPTAPTAATSTNTTQVATTAYVVGQAGSAAPLVNGTAAVGTSLLYSRQDHVHGTDTTRAPLASPTFTGTPAAPTASAGTNTTQLATTAFVRADNNVKAWVNFNGTGTPAIRASLNVSSITDNGVGDYTVNLTTAIADTNYCVVADCSYTANGSRGSIWAESYATSTTSTRIITSANSSPFVFDCVSVTVAILR